MSILTESKKTDLGVKAIELDLNKLTDTQMPIDGRYGVPVLNKQGYVRTTKNEYTDAFIELSKTATKPVLEIGCAYGHVVKQVLNLGAEIVASDLSVEMLEILVRDCPKEHLNNLHVYPGRFPDEVNFKKESFSGVLASRIMHFLDDTDFDLGLKKIRDWLIPGGKFYFTGVSVHKTYVRDNFLETYKENVKKGLEWAGMVENQLKFAPQHTGTAPEFIHVFDVPELEAILNSRGFKVDRISLFDYPDDLTSENKGHIGFVATKLT
jgi:polyketide synthase PksJ